MELARAQGSRAKEPSLRVAIEGLSGPRAWSAAGMLGEMGAGAEAAIPALLGRAARGITLDQVDLGLLEVLALTVGQLARHRAASEG